MQDKLNVLLSPINDSLQMDFSLEPQYIRKRHNNNSYLFMDSVDRSPQFNELSVFLLNSGPNLFARRIKRFAISNVNFAWDTPNVNPNNWQIRFFSTLSGIYHSVIVPEGFYIFSDLNIGLQTALNTVTGASGLTWTISATTDGHRRYFKSVVGAPGAAFFFDPTSTLITRGLHLLNLPIDQIPTSSKFCGAVQLFYTRWFDILSAQMLQYDKNPNASSRFGATNLLLRIDLTSPEIPHNELFEIDD